MTSLKMGNRKKASTVTPLRSIEGKCDEGMMKRFFKEMYGTRSIFRDPLKFDEEKAFMEKLAEAVLNAKDEDR